MSRAALADMDLRQIFPGVDQMLPPLDITDIETYSGRVGHGGLFLACRGTRQHGLEFLPDALQRGASAVAWEPDPSVREPRLPPAVIGIAVPGLRGQLGAVANRFFAQPSEQLRVVGITGTNGKTTVAWLVVQALQHLGRRPGYLGTLGYGLGTAVQPDVLTTPDCVTVHRRLRGFADAGADCAVAEVSSHALDQHRVDGVRFRTVAFTNLTPDHLDYHADLSAYGRAKERLFLETTADCAVINIADAFGAALAGRLPGRIRAITVAVSDAGAVSPPALTLRRVDHSPAGQGLEVSWQGRSAVMRTALWGAFNAENLAVAAGILLGEGFPLEAVTAALARGIAPPGRMERVGGPDGRPVVLVDFAHTPDALRRALATAREVAAGRIICVFGCGGNRDRGKRPLMGRVAAELADQVIVTDDNPRDEDPALITAGIMAGIATGAGDDAKVEVIHDRAAAINQAIRSAGLDDIVVIAGKGHETRQFVAGQAVAFSDAAVARAALLAPR